VRAALIVLSGCVVDNAIKVVDSAPRAVSEAARSHAVAPWSGRYVFSECAQPQVCWTYDIVIDQSMATVRADGPNLAIHVNARPTVEDNMLQLPFESYIDGKPDRSLHLPFQHPEGFQGGALLARIGRNNIGRWCLLFGALQSPMRSRFICE